MHGETVKLKKTVKKMKLTLIINTKVYPLKLENITAVPFLTGLKLNMVNHMIWEPSFICIGMV